MPIKNVRNNYSFDGALFQKNYNLRLTELHPSSDVKKKPRWQILYEHGVESNKQKEKWRLLDRSKITCSKSPIRSKVDYSKSPIRSKVDYSKSPVRK